MYHRPLTCFIIDDEPDAIDQLGNLLATHKEIEVIHTLENANNAISFIKKLKPDLLFLDIQMPGNSGLDLLKKLEQQEFSPKVIMVTAYNNYILDAFRNNAFDYILKPIDREELKNCLKRVSSKTSTEQSKQNFQQLFDKISQKIVLNGVYETYYLDAPEIVYIEADGRYSDIHLTNNKRIKTTYNLGKLEEHINHNTLQRISRSHLINSQYLHILNKRTKTCVLQYNNEKVELCFSKKYFG